ncbi:hypothetical protein DL96DRAFT_849159 [Flagelloscypha sp. PMI_526]|nr:hypothetical protein DL96DRAFT_849159 [Flagelloscypha sp. PMI_526]
MPYFDVYCMLSGIAAGGPPGIIPSNDEEIDFVVNILVERLVNSGRSDLPAAEELPAILKDTMVNDGRSHRGHRWGDTVAVFGPAHLDEDNPTYLRFCEDKGSMAWFDKTLDDNGEWIEKTIFIYESDPGDQECAFMFRKCWDYFQSWIDVLPPGVQDGKPFAKALWDVVEPSMGKGWQSDSILPELEYGDMLETWGRYEQGFWDIYDNDDMEMEERISQKLDIHCLVDVPNLAEAISKGLRGKLLIPALHGDLQTWMFEDPDMWPPYIQNSDVPTFRVFQIPTSVNSIKSSLSNLPLDILFEILPNLPLIDVLNTSAICKSMRNLLLRENIFPTLLRKMILYGSLRWIKPCQKVDGEVERAQKDLFSWIETEHGHDQITDALFDGKFPFVRFVHACLHKSDSMKSRKRLWGIAKQLEGKWNPDFCTGRRVLNR